MMMNIRLMKINDYQAVYALWMSCRGMGLNNLDDTEEGIGKFLERKETGNDFWEHRGFHVRTDIIYRNKSLRGN